MIELVQWGKCLLVMLSAQFKPEVQTHYEFYFKFKPFNLISVLIYVLFYGFIAVQKVTLFYEFFDFVDIFKN